jgi:hypothetical protein
MGKAARINAKLKANGTINANDNNKINFPIHIIACGETDSIYYTIESQEYMNELRRFAKDNKICSKPIGEQVNIIGEMLDNDNYSDHLNDNGKMSFSAFLANYVIKSDSWQQGIVNAPFNTIMVVVGRCKPTSKRMYVSRFYGCTNWDDDWERKGVPTLPAVLAMNRLGRLFVDKDEIAQDSYIRKCMALPIV